MRGLIADGATLDRADFSRANFSPAEPSKPAAAPVQPPSGADSQPDSAQEMLKALTTALAAQQPSQPTDLKPAHLKELKSAKNANFTGATMTRVVFDESNLAGAIFDTSEVSGASMAGVTFGQYPMPAKPEAKQPVKAAARRLTMQLGKATVAAAMETAGDGDDDDDDDDNDDDDTDQKEDSPEAQELLASMVKEGVEHFASAVANAVPQVIAACEKADQAIDAAVVKAKEALDIDSRALEEAASANRTTVTVAIDSRALEEAASASTNRATATVAVEGLMQKALCTLLDEVFSEAGGLAKLLGEAKKDFFDAAGDASSDAGRLVQDGAELGLPRVLKLLRSSVEKHADPLLKRLASGVAEKIGGRFMPAAGGTTRLRSLMGPSAKVSVQSVETEQLLDSPVLVYRKALHTLLNGVAACLDDPSVVTQQWLLQQGGKLLQGSGGGLANLGSRATAFQEALTSKLSEEHAEMVGGESLSQRLNTHVRSQTAKRALAGASRYAATGHVAMLNLVLSTDPLALTKNEKELTYVLEELGKLKDADVTSELWQDYYESWASFLSLRSNLKAECAQQIFDAIATDESVLIGLAAAHLLKDAVIKSGQVPNELLLQLKQGPAKHIKNYAYAYRHKLDAELTKIGRIRDMQQRAVALTGTCIIAAFVSTGNVFGRLYYDVLRADSTMAGIIAGVAIGTVLLVCITVAACVRRVRK